MKISAPSFAHRLPLCVAGLLATGCGDGGSTFEGRQTIYGQEGFAPWAEGAPVRAFGVLDADSRVIEVGAIVPRMALVDAPLEGAPSGEGPAGAFVVLTFPPEVQAQTFFNHVEIQWQPMGHEGTPWLPEIFETPHFDFHFYRVTEDEVRAIDPAGTPGVCGEAPDEWMVPEGYLLPLAGAEYEAACVPEMGVHAVPADLAEPFEAVMIFGFLAGRMHAIEPMITQAELAALRDVRIPIPLPAIYPAETTMPAMFTAVYDEASDAYRLTFDDLTPPPPPG